MSQKTFNPFNGTLFPLGFGVMRLPMNPNGTFEPEVPLLLQTAYENGINYFDTAYPYLGGHSEELVRDALVNRYPRESFYIADKLPVWDCHSRGDMEHVFATQLERLGTEYIDFYLLHGLNRFRWMDMYEKGVLDFLQDKKRGGFIRKIGFSMHDDAQTLTLILDAYDWEFAQLQINYYDWTCQHAKENYNLLAQRSVPCMVMEPVGGGRLANLPKQAGQLLQTERPSDSVASWAMRFAAGLPNVAVTLSGMSDWVQLQDNLAHFKPFEPLSKRELSLLDEVVTVITSFQTIPCSGCRYCLDACPVGVDIPQIFQRYIDYRQFGMTSRFDIDYFAFVPKARRAARCVGCGKCTAHCPQKIDIPGELQKIHNTAVGLSVGIDIETLKNELSVGTKLVCFGAGAVGRNTLSILLECGIAVDYFCDNSPRLWDTQIDGVPIISPKELQALTEASTVITAITCGYREEIAKQLFELGVPVLAK